MFTFGTKVKNRDGNTGVVTWIGQQFPDGWKVKVKWDGGGGGLVLTDTLTEVTP